MGDPAPAQAGRLADPRRQAMTATALRGISRFAATRGIPARAEVLLDYDVIEAFCVAGLRGLASPTRGTCRSVLRRLAGPVHGGPGQRAAPVAGAKPPPPPVPGCGPASWWRCAAAPPPGTATRLWLRPADPP